MISSSAHRIDREYRILSALHAYNSGRHVDYHIPIPEPVLLCKDPAVIGSSFYVMTFVEGRIFTDTTLPLVKTREDKREM